MSQNNQRKKMSISPGIYLLSSESIETRNELEDFVESLYDRLSQLASNCKTRGGFHLDKTIKRIIQQSKLNLYVEKNTNVYSSKLLEVSLQLTKKALESNMLLERLLLSIGV